MKLKNLCDCYLNISCVDGHCPLILEENRYGHVSSTCDDYCGYGFHGCCTCFFYKDNVCNECVHNHVKVK